MGQAGIFGSDRSIADSCQPGRGSKKHTGHPLTRGWLSRFCRLLDLSKTMKLAFKITLLLFAVIVLSSTITSFYLLSTESEF